MLMVADRVGCGAEALAAEIPGPGWCRWRGWAHRNPPRAVWEVFMPAVLEHTSGR